MREEMHRKDKEVISISLEQLVPQTKRKDLEKECKCDSIAMQSNGYTKKCNRNEESRETQEETSDEIKRQLLVLLVLRFYRKASVRTKCIKQSFHFLVNFFLVCFSAPTVCCFDIETKKSESTRE